MNATTVRAAAAAAAVKANQSSPHDNIWDQSSSKQRQDSSIMSTNPLTTTTTTFGITPIAERIAYEALYTLASLSRSPRARAVILGPENTDKLVAQLSIFIARIAKGGNESFQRGVVRAIGCMIGGERASAAALLKLEDVLSQFRRSKNAVVACEAEWLHSQLSLATAPVSARVRARH